jgi:hypothetical protein
VTCFLDDEAIVVDERGLSVFDVRRHRLRDHAAVLRAFDLIELDVTTFAGGRSNTARRRSPRFSAASASPSISISPATARSWCSGCLASVRWLDLEPPFCAAGGLVSADNGGIYDQVLEIGVI